MTDRGVEQVLIGQLTDTHVLATDDTETEVFVDNNGRLVEAVNSINAESPQLDVVLGTGDLTNDARPGEYDALGAIISQLAVPFLPLAGNHDERDRLRSRFPDVAWVAAEHLSWWTVVKGVRIVGLDSTRPDEPGGEIDETRAGWLDAVLAEYHDGVTLLAMHHPPFATGIGWMDQHGFPGLDLLAGVVESHRVDKIVCGHLHRPMTSTFAGVPAQVGMSTVQHVALDLRQAGEVAVVDDPVGYQIHRVVGGSVVTHSRFIGTGCDPIVPSWASKF